MRLAFSSVKDLAAMLHQHEQHTMWCTWQRQKRAVAIAAIHSLHPLPTVLFETHLD